MDFGEHVKIIATKSSLYKLMQVHEQLPRMKETKFSNVISEMKGEISEMRELAMTANQEIKNGKHFGDWMRLNLKPELQALGLDSEHAGFQDLMSRLGQNVAEPPQIQEAALEM